MHQRHLCYFTCFPSCSEECQQYRLELEHSSLVCLVPILLYRTCPVAAALLFYTTFIKLYYTMRYFLTQYIQSRINLNVPRNSAVFPDSFFQLFIYFLQYTTTFSYFFMTSSTVRLAARFLELILSVISCQAFVLCK